jgi:primase-polymerase (primpol)-like protein
VTLTGLDLVMIPDELCERAQWVVWRLEQRDGKPTKVLKGANIGVAGSR